MQIDFEIIDNYIDNFEHKYKEGFTLEEIQTICEYFNTSFEKFNKELRGNTCMEIDNQLIVYDCDIRNILYKLLLGYQDIYSWD